jgi:hypothetical protein
MHRDFSWYVLQVTMKFQIQNGMSVIQYMYIHVHVYTCTCIYIVHILAMAWLTNTDYFATYVLVINDNIFLKRRYRKLKIKVHVFDTTSYMYLPFVHF